MNPIRALPLVVILAACSPTDYCHTGIWLEPVPEDTTLSIGQSFAPQIWLEVCPDARFVDAVFSTNDGGVVAIDGSRIEAIGAGVATILADAGGMTATLRVEVVE